MDKVKRPYPDKARQRIKATRIIKKLQKHVMGKVEMTPTQVHAARILLGKVLPELKATEHSGEVRSKPARELTNAELNHELADMREILLAAEGTEEKEDGTRKRGSVH